MKIRPATLQDTPAILEMGRTFHADSGYAETHGAYCYASTSASLTFLLDNGVVLVAENDHGIFGMIGLALAPGMFNRAHVSAHEVMWWVHPEARESGVGLALMREAEAACKAAGAVAIQMIHLASSPPAAAAIYQRLGYQPSESMFTKGL